LTEKAIKLREKTLGANAPLKKNQEERHRKDKPNFNLFEKKWN
jgi:hypothetical protein